MLTKVNRKLIQNIVYSKKNKYQKNISKLSEMEINYLLIKINRLLIEINRSRTLIMK